ncbi:MAG: flagellar motor switch protein FliG [Nitrospirota bacterium]
MARKLTGEEKAVILLRAIGEDAAARVMKCLEPKEIRRIGASMKEMANIARDEEEEVIAEFEKASTSGEIGFAGREYVKTVLTKALGPEKAARVLESLTSASYPGLDMLKWVDSKTIVQLARVEHPQTVAVILAYMDPEQASQVLAGLPEAMRVDVALRLATMEEVRPEVLQELSDALQESLAANAGPGTMSVGGAEVIADILTRLDKSTESAIMAKITERDQMLADGIRALMFVFDDLIKLDDRSIQELLKEIGKDELPVALRGASPDVKERFFRNMSSRAAEMLKEDMEARGPVKLSDVEKAQQNILKICRKLEEEGRIVVAGFGEELI